MIGFEGKTASGTAEYCVLANFLLAQGFCCSVQVLYGINQRLRIEDVDSPLVDVRPVKSVLLVCVTGDRGLCGGYNNNIIKRVKYPAPLLPHPCANGQGALSTDQAGSA